MSMLMAEVSGSKHTIMGVMENKIKQKRSLSGKNIS